jgi:hypothetical protein
VSIPATRRQEIIEELAKRDAERLEEALLTALDDGWLIFAKGKPRERLGAYLQNTLAEDIPLVCMDGDYLELLAAGQAPLLRAVQMVQARQAERGMVDPETRIPVEPQTPQPPLLWPIIISTQPKAVFDKLASDMRTLLRAQDKREPDRREPWGVS